MQFRDTVEIYRATPIVGDYGSHRDWENPELIASSRCIIIQASSNENTTLPLFSAERHDIDRELSFTNINIYLRPVDCKSSDRVLANGVMYEVFGEPVTWRGQTATYMRITARRVANG
jgi:hypothetical protein